MKNYLSIFKTLFLVILASNIIFKQANATGDLTDSLGPEIEKETAPSHNLTQEVFGQFLNDAFNSSDLSRIEVALVGIGQKLSQHPEKFEEVFNKAQEILAKYKNEGSSLALKEARALLTLGRIHSIFVSHRDSFDTKEFADQMTQKVVSLFIETIQRFASEDENLKVAEELLKESIQKGVYGSSFLELTNEVKAMNKNQAVLFLQAFDSLAEVALSSPDSVRSQLGKLNDLKIEGHYFASSDGKSLLNGLEFLTLTESELNDRLSLLNDNRRIPHQGEAGMQWQKRSLLQLDMFRRALSFLAQRSQVLGRAQINQEHPLVKLINVGANVALRVQFQDIELKRFENLSTQGDFFAIDSKLESGQGRMARGLSYFDNLNSIGRSGVQFNPWLRPSLKLEDLKTYNGILRR